MDKQGLGIMLPGGISEPKVTEAVELDLPKHVELKEPGEYGMSAGTEPYQRANISHRAISVEDLAIVMMRKRTASCRSVAYTPSQTRNRTIIVDSIVAIVLLNFARAVQGVEILLILFAFFLADPEQGAQQQRKCHVVSPPCRLASRAIERRSVIVHRGNHENEAWFKVHQALACALTVLLGGHERIARGQWRRLRR